MTNLDSVLKSRDIILTTKIRRVKAMVFSSSHVLMWELDHNKGWVPKNWCFQTMMLEKTPESPLDSKEIKAVNPKGNQPEYSLEGPMLKLKLQYCGHLMWWTDWLKTLMLGKIEGRRRREQQRKMIGWHHWLNEHEFEQAPGDGEGQGSLVCCSPWGHRESDMTELVNSKMGKCCQYFTHKAAEAKQRG